MIANGPRWALPFSGGDAVPGGGMVVPVLAIRICASSLGDFRNCQTQLWAGLEPKLRDMTMASYGLRPLLRKRLMTSHPMSPNRRRGRDGNRWRNKNMKRFILCLIMLLMVSPMAPLRAQSLLHNFITVQGDQLMDGKEPFRFISFNIPNLLIVEDNTPFTETNSWRLPDEFELRDGLATVRQMGGTVVRTYSIPVWRGNDPPAESSYVLGVDRYNENAFRTFDLALKVANEEGVRLIIPLVNNWKWQGGRGELAGFRGKLPNDFWTDPQLIADFERVIRYVLLRTNTLTGVRYCDDKAILCWETGNELSSPPAWAGAVLLRSPRSLRPPVPRARGRRTRPRRRGALSWRQRSGRWGRPPPGRCGPLVPSWALQTVAWARSTTPRVSRRSWEPSSA